MWSAAAVFPHYLFLFAIYLCSCPSHCMVFPFSLIGFFVFVVLLMGVRDLQKQSFE